MILIWLRSAFEANFHTDPEAKFFFCLVEQFPCYAMISAPTFEKNELFYTRGRCF